MFTQFKKKSLLGFSIFLFSISPAVKGEVLLTLSDAIYLTLRTNPKIQNEKLDYLIKKFDLNVARWNFKPHYEIEGQATSNRNTTWAGGYSRTDKYSVTPRVSLLLPYGTIIKAGAKNAYSGHYNPSVSYEITQPLMRGFGKAIVEAALYDAEESLRIFELKQEETIRATTTDVINAYLDVVNSEKTVAIDLAAVKRAQESYQQTKLYIQAGSKAGNELITTSANVASAKSHLEIDKNNLQQSKYALLAAIGLNPNKRIALDNINLNQLIKKYKLPTLNFVQEAVLKNDIQYQIDYLTLHGSLQRRLLEAKNNTRWQLDLSITGDRGNQSGSGPYAGFRSLNNGSAINNGVALNLKIPLDNQAEKQKVFSAAIEIKKAQTNLQQEKWKIETDAINNWNNVISNFKALKYAEDAARLQKQTYQINFQKYLHGLIDSLQLQSAQSELINSEQSLLSAQIAYIKSLVNLDKITGHTLQTWQIKLKIA